MLAGRDLPMDPCACSALGAAMTADASPSVWSVASSTTASLARGLLDWTQQELADDSRCLHPQTDEPSPLQCARREATLAVLQRAFEEAGVEFIDENGGGPGVRLRKRQTTKRKSRT